MIIHVVQPGETAYEIALKYGVSVERLILENDIQNPNNLAAGEALAIVKPNLILQTENLSIRERSLL